MKKHILPLTYEPKIPDVLNGKCTQTIRSISYSKSKEKGDLVMFHGWSDKPYQSKWSFRTPYWEIIQSFDFHFEMENGNISIRKADEFTNFHTISNKEIHRIAVLDGFKNIRDLYAEFHRMYGDDICEKIFTVIRWKWTK